MRDLTLNELTEKKIQIQVELSKLPQPTNPHGRRLSAQISTIDNLINAIKNKTPNAVALGKKVICGGLEREFIKKGQNFL